MSSLNSTDSFFVDDFISDFYWKQEAFEHQNYLKFYQDIFLILPKGIQIMTDDKYDKINLTHSTHLSIFTHKKYIELTLLSCDCYRGSNRKQTCPIISFSISFISTGFIL